MFSSNREENIIEIVLKEIFIHKKNTNNFNGLWDLNSTQYGTCSSGQRIKYKCNT